MSVKKLLILAAAGACATAFAGGSNSYTMASNNTNVSSSAFAPYAYADVNGGYDFTGVKNAAASGVTFNNGGNAWVFGGDVGYMFMKNLGVELGGSYFTNVSGSGVYAGAKLKQYDVYVAPKMVVNVANNVDLFGKVGLDFHHLSSNSGSTAPSYQSVNTFGPTFGAGVDYTFMPNWKATFQWRSVAGVTKYSSLTKLTNNTYAIPTQNLVTLGVGYNFAA